jgi:Ser/Thr protein kinase RdoA (MazF antagonist)
MRSAADLLQHWELAGALHESPDAGLINGTWLVGEPPSAVLQWVNPIFASQVQLDIDLFCRRLESSGMVTPRLIPTQSGELWVEDPEGGCWRAMSFIPGSTYHRLRDPGMAHEAGRLVGQMHAAVDGWEPRRYAPVRNIHDTPSRIAELQSALSQHPAHPLRASVEPVALGILEDWFSWEGSLEQPLRHCHGDLKISNLRFDKRGEKAVALIDLDTVGPMTLDAELGDAWRSWCNPSGEDQPDTARFDLELFEASAQGFASTAPALLPEEWSSLVPGIERICLELASRFCADALNNSYFKEDRISFPTPGTHNLHKAMCQLALARSVRSHRTASERILAAARP